MLSNDLSEMAVWMVGVKAIFQRLPHVHIFEVVCLCGKRSRGNSRFRLYHVTLKMERPSCTSKRCTYILQGAAGH